MLQLPAVIEARERQLQSPRSLAARLQASAEPVREPRRRRRQRLRLQQRLGEGEPLGDRHLRPHRLDRLGHASERLVQPPHHLRAQALDQRCARQGGELADAAQPEAMQQGDRLRPESQRLHRHRQQRREIARRRHRQLLAPVARQRVRSTGRIGQGEPAGQSGALEP